MGVERGGGFFKNFFGKVGASCAFDSTTITEFVNQKWLFIFSASLLSFGQWRSHDIKLRGNLVRCRRIFLKIVVNKYVFHAY